jgi:uncharacterized protein (TIGR02611 family)
VRARKERHKQRSRLYRIAVAVAGGVLVIAGIILALPLVPGPGFLLIAIGLGLLALEFDWAERLLERIVDRVEEAGEKAAHASTAQMVVAAAVVVLLAVGAVTAVLLWDIPFVPG